MPGLTGPSALSGLSGLVGGGVAYYVDATGGNDGNSGLSPTAPWQTIGKVNGETFQPGDSILFKRGETWTGTQLTIPSSGEAGRPILFGTYDSGAKPIIDGNDAVNCIDGNGKEYLRFENIETTQGLDHGFEFSGATHNNITLVDCDAHDCGNDNLIFFNGANNCTVIGGNFYDAYQRVGGTTTSGIEIGDACYDILVDGATCYGTLGTAGQGITVHNHAATTFPYNITIQNCTCYNNSQMGIQVLKADNTADADRNILVDGCTCYDNTLDGIYIWRTGTEYINGLTLDGNYSYSNTRRALGMRGDSITIQRNVFSGDNNNPVYIENSVGVTLYNNTIYATAGYAGFNGMVLIDGARMANFVMQNCIVEAESTNPYMVQVSAGSGIVGYDIDYNLYGYTGAANRWTWLVAKDWTNWLADSGQDANSPARADPLFVNPGTDFRLQAGSPARGAGTDVGFGTDIGAFQYTA